MVGLFALPALAQYTRDTSANQKIDEAINQHYLMMELDKSEQLLVGVVQACDTKCSPQTKAKAWMYVGVVRGSGKNDQAGAKEAFVTAKGLDPAVKLDRDLASPETAATFDAVPGGTAPAPVAAAPVAAAPVAAAAGGDEIPGDMVCTPEVRDIQTRMPIPVSCTSAAETTSAELKFKEFGGDKWKKISMTKSGEYWQAEIPCDVTGTAGKLSWYVGAKNAAGEYVDQYGSKKQPASFQLSNSEGEAPAYPGQAPVNRCAEQSDCPPDFPGCNSGSQTCGELDWGASCSNSTECKCGLLCSNGTCENAPSCSKNEDCDSGSCVSGKCAAGASDAPSGPFAKHWLGVDLGFDLVYMGGPPPTGAGLCAPNQETSYGTICYDAAGQPSNDLRAGAQPGFASGQLRVKLGYDLAITDHLQLGARVGLGFLNTRPGFIPVSAEARATYNFTSLANPGFRPFAYVQAGLYEVNGHVESLGLDIYRTNKSLPIAVTPGLGFVYALNANMGLKLDVGAVLTFGPSFGFGLLPQLGFTYGL
ncbi:MAG TPA: hypothetical protein VLC09_09095, partial [Polyangiaceae bacterium]|nr:hypothetical protein [Polyangiaceae bacterium]